MKAIILAAGKGTRMPKITRDKPKCLIEIGRETIIERQIKILLKFFIEKIYVVIGYKADKIREELRGMENVKLIENRDYATTENMYSLYLAKNYVKEEEFVLLNGDAVFDEEIIKKLVAEKEKDVAPIDGELYDLEKLKVREKNGLVVEILPKTAPSKISDGSTIGIFKFSSEGSRILFDEIGRCVGQGIRNKWFEYSLNNILKKIRMRKLDIHGSRWVEVDTEEDIKRTKKLFGE